MFGKSRLQIPSWVHNYSESVMLKNIALFILKILKLNVFDSNYLFPLYGVGVTWYTNSQNFLNKAQLLILANSEITFKVKNV